MIAAPGSSTPLPATVEIRVLHVSFQRANAGDHKCADPAAGADGRPLLDSRNALGRSKVVVFQCRQEPLLGVGKGDIGAQADHAEAGGGALTAAEGAAGFKFAFERSGERDDEQVSGGIE